MLWYVKVLLRRPRCHESAVAGPSSRRTRRRRHECRSRGLEAGCVPLDFARVHFRNALLHPLDGAWAVSVKCSPETKHCAAPNGKSKSDVDTDGLVGADLEYVFFERHEAQNWSIHLFPSAVRCSVLGRIVSAASCEMPKPRVSRFTGQPGRSVTTLPATHRLQFAWSTLSPDPLRN